jgi:predicted DNA-binding ribbon-helix-helix protein
MMSVSARRPPRRGGNGSTLVIHNVVVAGHRTSVRLEPVMWDALREIARKRQRSLNDLVTEIDRDRDASSLTAAIRVYIVDYYRSASAGAERATERPQPVPM